MPAQPLRWGVIGGTALTADYPPFTEPGYSVQLPDGSTLTVPPRVTLGAGRHIYGGASVEWQVTSRFSVEGDAIYRRLRSENSGPTVTWQFPVLAKVRVPLGRWGVFLSGGPSFRTTGNRNTNPSHVGITGGAGVNWDLGAWRLSPTVRYTRWARDPVWTVPSKHDQVEVFLGLSRGAGNFKKPFGDRVRFGVVGGISVNQTTRTVLFIQQPEQFLRREPKRTGIVGPHFAFTLSEQWELLAEATYRQIRTRDVGVLSFPTLDGERRQIERDEVNVMAILWQFPVLVKRHWGAGGVRPYLEAGPSFRLPQDYNGNLGTVGITGGAGVGFNLGAMRVEPGLRFTHWGAARDRLDRVEPNLTRRNQLDAVVAITF